MAPEPRPYELGIMIGQGLSSLVALGLFIVGLLLHIATIWTVGGALLVILTVLRVAVGALNPLAVVILAGILAAILRPWLLGVFWAIAVFEIIGVRFSLRQVFTPATMVERILRRGSEATIDRFSDDP